MNDEDEDPWYEPEEDGQITARERPYFLGFAAVVFTVLVVATLWMAGPALSRVFSSLGPPALAAEESVLASPELADRMSCPEIGISDLRSPLEGIWYQGNCVAASTTPLLDGSTVCNRSALDAGEFAEVAPGLHVFRRSFASTGYLWYARSEGCFDLVSARVVTMVCVDLTVSFAWDAKACTAHGGVLTRVNGP